MKEYNRQDRRDFNNGFTFPFIGLMIVSLLMLIVLNQSESKKPEIKPCVCVTYSQYALWSEKYNRFVSENKPDSVAKYAELLNQIK